MANKHDLGKDYYELYAKLLLETALPDEFVNLIHQDRPDLVCAKNDIGIEVTRALFPNEGNAQGMLNRFKGKTLAEVKPSAIELMEKNGYRFFVHNEHVRGYMPTEGFWVSLDPLKQAYTPKSKKLADYPQHKENDLFIFGPMFDYYESNDIIEFMQWMRSITANQPYVYDRVFVFDEPVLYMCNAANDSVKAYKFPRATLNQLCQQALDMCE